MTKTEKAIEWMEQTASNNTHGYDQRYRWGEKGDYDCSSAVITAWELAGVPVKTRGATYTGNMYTVFCACGFKDVTASVNVHSGSGLMRGDVLLNDSHHVAMYCGNGRLVNASINEKGTAIGGAPGDQTGREFLIRSYYNYPWLHILRYSESGQATALEPVSVTGTGHCTGDQVNIRSGPGTQYANIAGWPRLNKGNQFDICSQKNGWYYIRIAGKFYGWIFGKYVAVDQKKEATSAASAKTEAAQYMKNSIAGRYKVVASALNLRSGAGTSKNIIAVLKRGTIVQCYGYYNMVGAVKWYLIVADGKTGYASADYLRRV